MTRNLDSLAEAAIQRRASLLDDPRTTCCRLFGAHEVPGLAADKLSDVAILQIHVGRFAGSHDPQLLQLAAWLARRLGLRAVYAKPFVKDRTARRSPDDDRLRQSAPLLGERVEEEFTVMEGGLKFAVRPYDGFSAGLFLDHRDNRRIVRGISGRREVLNLFCYTGAFTVSAAAGGAKHATSVDISRKFLQWTRRNLSANDLPAGNHSLICEDAMSYLRRCAKRDRRFDLVIVDPPTFARSRRPHAVFSVQEHLPLLLRMALQALASPGTLLASTNHQGTSLEALLRMVRSAGGGRRRLDCQTPPPPVDFAGDPAAAKTVLAHFQ